jgi:predicted nucleic acid-binding protein
MSLVYLDTNVIMDILLDRFPNPTAVGLLSADYTYLISDLVEGELKQQKVDAYPLFRVLECMHKIRFHATNRDDKALAIKYSRLTHYSDALHAAIAFNNRAAVLTRNTKDFRMLPVKLIHPDDI